VTGATRDLNVMPTRESKALPKLNGAMIYGKRLQSVVADYLPDIAKEGKDQDATAERRPGAKPQGSP
jgi:hypothetical protein